MAINIQSNSIQSSSGFTLVEMMIALLMSTFVVFAVYTAFEGQQKVQLNQNEVVETQQNLRAAMELIMRDARMAAYDPTKGAGAGFTNAQPGRFTLTKDTTDTACTGNPDGIINASACEETVSFGFSNAIDADNDGNPDAGVASDFGRDIGAGYQPIAELIERVEFIYLDSAGAATATLNDIRSIQISLLARSDKQDPQYTDTKTYTSASGTNWGPYNDNYRRRLLTATVNCRNMGL